MKDDEKAFLAKMRAAQEIRIGNGIVNQVIEGKVGVRDALREQLETQRGELRNTSEYDPVLKSHCRV